MLLRKVEEWNSDPVTFKGLKANGRKLVIDEKEVSDGF